MVIRRSIAIALLACAALPSWDGGVVVSAEQKEPGEAPAASVPTRVITRAQAGIVTIVEAGDLIEIRLPEPAAEGSVWRLIERRGEPALTVLNEPTISRDEHGEMIRLFRYRVVSAGRTELVFTRESVSPAATHERLGFTIEVR